MEIIEEGTWIPDSDLPEVEEREERDIFDGQTIIRRRVGGIEIGKREGRADDAAERALSEAKKYIALYRYYKADEPAVREVKERLKREQEEERRRWEEKERQDREWYEARQRVAWRNWVTEAVDGVAAYSAGQVIDALAKAGIRPPEVTE